MPHVPAHLLNHAWLDEFNRVERRDPLLGAVHLGAACFWCAALSLGHAPESIAFGILLVVALLRVPRTHALYASLVRSTPFLLYAAWTVWNIASFAWSDVPLHKVGELVPRPLLALLALWPMAARWPLLLGALATGASASAIYTCATSIRLGGVRTRDQAGRLMSHLASASFMASVGACVLLALAVHLRSVRAWLGALVASGVCCLQVAVLAGRASLIFLAAGFVATLAVPSKARLPRARGWTVAAIGALALAAVAVNGPYLLERFRNFHPNAEPDSTIHESLVIPIANERVTLWRVAWQLGWERPLVGHGSNSWKAVGGAYIKEHQQELGKARDDANFLAALPTPHNMYINAWFTLGGVGVVLFLCMVATMLHGCFRNAANSWTGRAMLGVAAVWCVAGLFTAVDQIAVGAAVLALLVASACMRPPSARSSVSWI
jgi:O-antigen ligase